MAYKTYQATNYPGSDVFDIFPFNVATVTGGSSVSVDAKFSNPFVILGGYNNSNKSFLSYQDIEQNIMVFSYGFSVNSGLLRQQDVGGTITELGACLSSPLMLQRLFQLTDLENPGQTLYTDTPHLYDTISYPRNYSNFNLLPLLNTSFDSFAIPQDTVFTLSPNGFDIVLIIAVKRGNNQPFFTLLP